MSLYLETAWTERKAHITKKILVFFFQSIQFPNRVTCRAEISFGIHL
jgi:hypothetical protein